MDLKLSYEMIMEIISRASLKTLDTMRCASTTLNTLTYESYLLALHMQRNKIVSGFLIQYVKNGWRYTNEFAPSNGSSGLDLRCLPYNANILATSEQGIMVFQIRAPAESSKLLFHVCKPATKQVLVLPSPRGNNADLVYKLALVVMSMKPLHYKIIRFIERFARRSGNTAYRCEVFDSMTLVWRSLKHIELAVGVYLSDSQPITKSGSVYMLLNNKDILKFDAHTERWKVLQSPIRYYADTSRPSSVELVKYGEKLGLVCKPLKPNGCWEIWVLKKGQLWENIYVYKEKEGEEGSLRAFYDIDTSVMVAYNILKFNRFKHEGDTMINKVVLKDFPSQIFSFRSDFEPVDLV